MKKNNTINIVSIILIILGITMITVALVLSHNTKNTNNKNDNDNKNNTIEEVTKKTIDNTYISKDTDKTKIEKETGQQLSYHDIYVGKDSFVSYKPSSEIIKKYNLQNYEKLQSKYAPIVEKRFIDGTSYKVEKVDKKTVKYIFKPWYYEAYSSDLELMIDTLIDQTKEITKDDIMQATEKYIVYEYKARVKSIYLLNKYLSNYDNQDEEFEFIINLKEETITEDDQYSIYMNLSGNRSTKMIGDKDESAVKKRVDSYLNEFTKSKIIDSKDPLSIKDLS